MIYKHYQWKQRKEDPVWRTTNFLPAQDSTPHATSALALLIALADNLPACDDLRAAIDGLPEVRVYASADQAPESPPGPRSSPVLVLTHEAERERAFGALAFLASAYVHAGGSGSASPCPGAALASELPAGHPPLPPCAAAPPAATTGGATPVTLPPALGGSLLRLAEALDRPPILDYASCVLLNTVGPTQLEPEDVTIRRTFTGTESERWFYAIHVAIEAHGAMSSTDTRRACEFFCTRAWESFCFCSRLAHICTCFCSRLACTSSKMRARRELAEVDPVSRSTPRTETRVISHAFHAALQVCNTA